MDIGMERNEGSATIGTLFQQIVNDMKNSSPLWEDFIAKATKLHACLRAAIQALSVYLEAFQKIADAATNSKGATKEIGTALTRVCLRHKAVETRMKTFTSAIMDCLIVPLQEKLEDWKKQLATIDKDHAKEYKRCRTELKKRSSDTLRLQKKAKKGQADNLHVLVESSMQDVTLRRCELEEVERKSLRAIMVEERSRYCTFVNFLQPVVHEECEVLSELGHLQEAMQLIAVVTRDASVLPQASEELILESKANINLYPDSPGGSNSQGGCSNSLGSRKSSVCSISSMNSSSSGSPGHQFQRSLSQYTPAIRLKPGESSDSGFCSSPALTSQATTLASQSNAVSTWPPHTQDSTTAADRPHTISSAYEKGHQRPALTVYTFQNPETISENQKTPANISCRPPLPVRCSSLERPLSTASIKNQNPNAPRLCPSPIPAHITKEHPQLQPTYVNMTELASMAASKITNNNSNSNNNNATNQPPSTAQTPLNPQHMGYQQLQQQNSPVLSSASASSLISPDSSATNAISSPDVSASSTQTPQNTPQTGSPQTPTYSCNKMLLAGNSGSDSNDTAQGGCGANVVGNGATLGGNNITAYRSEGSAGMTPSVSDGTIVLSPASVPTTASSEKYQDETDKRLPQLPLAVSTLPDDVDHHHNSQSNPNNTPTSSISTITSEKEILKCSGSVLEKTSMFEQQINNNQTQQHHQQLHRGAESGSACGRKSEEIYRTSTGLLSVATDRETDRIDKETIEELNNLIGELDLFQKEHELRLEEQLHLVPTGCREETLFSNIPPKTNGNGSGLSDLNSSTNSESASSDRHDVHSIASSLNMELSSYSNAAHVPEDNSLGQNSSDIFDLSSTGFENPSFVHLNESEIVVIRQNEFGRMDPENYYSQSMSEVVVLRCKDSSSASTPATMPTNNCDVKSVEDNSIKSSDGQQRLSSFKAQSRSASPALSSFGVSRSPTPSLSLLPVQTNSVLSIPTSMSPQKHEASLLVIHKNGSSGNNTNNDVNTSQGQSLQKHVTSITNGAPRVTRRASVNTVKPPPPVRRSSSVTPSPNLVVNSPNLAQQSQTYTSSESLPPPPAYLLNSVAGNTPIPGNVAGTVKALNDIRHKPASPSVLRRSHLPNQQTTTQPSSTNRKSALQTTHQQGIYAQPKQLTTMSSFRTASPGPQKQHSGLIAQLNARISPGGKSQSQPNQPSSQSYQQQHAQIQEQGGYGYASGHLSEPIYQRSVPHPGQHSSSLLGIYHPAQSQQPQPQPSAISPSLHYYQHQESYHAATPANNPNDDHLSRAGAGTGNPSGTNNVLAKTSAGFLENLNARIAEQRLSGRAFAVRSLINSKALPDPRVCHESLMDQIKRGATLKRNCTINDRSAPKIH